MFHVFIAQMPFSILKAIFWQNIWVNTFERPTIDSMMVCNDISKLLNKQVIKDEFKLRLGQLCYVPSLLQQKNPHSVFNALRKVTHISEGGRTYQLQLLNKQKITRHIFHLVPTSTNANDCKNQPLDLFCLPKVEEVIVPQMVTSKFDLYLNSFDLTNPNQGNDPVSILPDKTAAGFDFRNEMDREAFITDSALPCIVCPLPDLYTVSPNQDQAL